MRPNIEICTPFDCFSRAWKKKKVRIFYLNWFLCRFEMHYGGFEMFQNLLDLSVCVRSVCVRLHFLSIYMYMNVHDEVTCIWLQIGAVFNSHTCSVQCSGYYFPASVAQPGPCVRFAGRRSRVRAIGRFFVFFLSKILSKDKEWPYEQRLPETFKEMFRNDLNTLEHELEVALNSTKRNQWPELTRFYSAHCMTNDSV